MPSSVAMFNMGIGNRFHTRPASLLDFWTGLSSRERLITLGILTAGAVAIINSTAWAIAVGRLSRRTGMNHLMPSRVEAQAGA